MNYLSVENLTKSFGERVLFEDLTFGIDKGEKVAVVAKNGNGKSTLLKIICGDGTEDIGRIVYRKDIRLDYLEQAENFDPEKNKEELIKICGHYVLSQTNFIKEIKLKFNKIDDKIIKNILYKLNKLHGY